VVDFQKLAQRGSVLCVILETFGLSIPINVLSPVSPVKSLSSRPFHNCLAYKSSGAEKCKLGASAKRTWMVFMTRLQSVVEFCVEPCDHLQSKHHPSSSTIQERPQERSGKDSQRGEEDHKRDGVNTMLTETMTTNDAHGDNSSGTADMEDQASSPEARSPQQAPLPPYSGLSALIQAATAQLSDLTDVAASRSTTNSSSLTPPEVSERGIRPQTFPDKLMTLCTDPGNSNSITFLPDGKFFAIRRSTFQQKLDAKFDGVVTNFDEFLDLAENWGFSAIIDNGIAILRHPCFVAGDYEKCARIRYGESPESVRMHALPDRARVVVNEDCFQSPKRRLSPGHLARRDSVSSVSSRHKVNESNEIDNDPTNFTSVERKVSAGAESELSAATATEEDNIRSMALAITTEKLKIKSNHEGEQDPEHLVETAVTSATHEIVADAITTLLRDEGHSKETFLKHEKELSRSSIPGVIPVCKQIFSPSSSNAASTTTQDGPTKSFAKTAPPSRVVTNGSTMVEVNGNSKPAAHQLHNDSSKRPASAPPTQGMPSSFEAEMTPPIIQVLPGSGGVSPVHELPAQIIQPACNTALPSSASSAEPRIKTPSSTEASSSAVAM